MFEFRPRAGRAVAVASSSLFERGARDGGYAKSGRWGASTVNSESANSGDCIDMRATVVAEWASIEHYMTRVEDAAYSSP